MIMIKKDISRQKGCLRSAGENKETVSHPILFHFVPGPCAFISRSALVMQVLSPCRLPSVFLPRGPTLSAKSTFQVLHQLHKKNVAIIFFSEK